MLHLIGNTYIKENILTKSGPLNVQRYVALQEKNKAGVSCGVFNFNFI